MANWKTLRELSILPELLLGKVAKSRAEKNFRKIKPELVQRLAFLPSPNRLSLSVQRSGSAILHRVDREGEVSRHGVESAFEGNGAA
jgi:hypothetical protein